MSDDTPGRCILVVEDEFFIARDLADALRSEGYEVVGPVASVADALALLEGAATLDGAVLDINLRGEMAYAVADALIGRGIPVVFATGYDKSVIPPRYARVPRCEKPVEPGQVVRALFPAPASGG